jgi:hypothetical protein
LCSVFTGDDEAVVFFADVKVVRVLGCNAHFAAEFFGDVDSPFFRNVSFVICRIIAGGFYIDRIVLINELRHSAGDEPESLPPLFGQSDHSAAAKDLSFIQFAQHIVTPSFTLCFSLTRNLEMLNPL